MKDREKIVEIIKKNGTYNGRSLSFDYYVVKPNDLVTALIENDIGDIIEWKHRAEVAERALLHALETAICDGQCPECDIKFAGNCKGTDKDIRDCAALDVEDYLQQAEKELAKEGKDD